MVPDYKPITKEKALSIIKDIDVLILTATDVETTALHEQLTPIDGQIFKAGIDAYTYFIARFGNYLILHTQCSAGSATFGGSSVVTSHAINLKKPKAIIMVGIAFGVDNEKQKIGDVLISETLWPYEVQRIGTEKSIHRGGNPRASAFLLDRFRNPSWSYEYTIGSAKKKFKSNVKRGILFSGEKLVDDLAFRERLKKEVPEAIGGEMEGSGIAIAAEASKADWIVIKAICDFADGEKGKNKSAFQKAAAKAAVNYCKTILLEDHILSEIGVATHNSSELSVEPQLVLFRKYSIAAEPYYHERQVDHWFNDYRTQYSIWLHGESGCGKSTVIIRNLQKKGYDIIQICLASGTDYDIDSILREILAKLSIHFGVSIDPNNTTEELITVISKLIIQKFDFKQQIIYLDEIPEYRDLKVFESFFHSIYAINVNVVNSVPGAQSVFVLSSIASPTESIHKSQQKLLESFKFKLMHNWSDEDIDSLFEITSDALKLSFTGEEVKKIKKTAKGGPRNLKRIIRDFLATKENPHITLDRILSEVEAEL